MQIERIPITLATSTARLQVWGFSLPSKHFLVSGWYLGQFRQYTYVHVTMFSLLLSTVFIASGKKPAYFLRYADSNFVISKTINGAAIDRVPINNSQSNGMQSIEYRRDQVFVVWDDRGLTVRDGKVASSTRFQSVPTSPRLRIRDDILKTISAHQNQDLDYRASALSGSVRIGVRIFGIARWTTTSQKTWLECLFDVNLMSAKPSVHVLTVLPGHTFSTHFIGHSLFLSHQKLQAYIQIKNQWGRWEYNPKNGKASFLAIGRNPVSIVQFPNKEVGFVEKSPIGSFYTGIFDPVEMNRESVQELNSQPMFLTNVWPPVIEAKQRGLPCLVNLDKGTTLFLAQGSQAKECQAGVIIWTGSSNPQKAWLFSPALWQPIAWWANQSAKSTSH